MAAQRKSNQNDYEIWSDYFRIKNEIMDRHITFLSSVSLLGVLKAQGHEETTKFGITRLAALRQLEELYDLACSSGAFPLEDGNHDLIVEVIDSDWKKVTLSDLRKIKRVIRVWVTDSGYYDIRVQKQKVYGAENATAELH